MAVFEMTDVINAPVSKVMGLANDAKRHHEWVSGVVKVEVTPGNRGRVGESWVVTFSMMGMRSKAKSTILQWEENKRAVWRHEGGMEGTEIQTYESVNEGTTRSTLKLEYRLTGFMGLMGPLMVPVMKKMYRRGGANLKRICEAEAKQ